jgi:PAS domain S-box-containing protein
MPNEGRLDSSAPMPVRAPMERESIPSEAGPQSKSWDRPVRVLEQRHAPGPRRVDVRILMEAIDLAGTLIVLLDPAGRVVSFNRAFEHASGWSAEEVCGHLLWTCPFVLPGDMQAIRCTAREPSSNGLEWQMRHRDGTVRVVSWRGRSLPGQDGAPEHILLAGAEVTALRHAEDEVNNRLAQLSDLHRIHVVEGLGSVIAHDLNQPLAAVLLLAESALRQTQLFECASAELIKDLETIVKQVHRAGTMTKGLRRFLAGSSECNAPIDIERTIRGACELVAGGAGSWNRGPA